MGHGDRSLSFGAGGCRARGFHGARRREELLFAFHRTRTGHEGEIAAADFHAIDIDDGVAIARLAADELVAFLDGDDFLDLWQRTGVSIVFVTHSVFESVFLSQRIVVMAARPGRVLSELSIAASYPRSAAFRTSAEYAAYSREASARLGEAMAA